MTEEERRAYQREYYAKNREKIRAQQNAHHAERREIIREQSKESYQRNKENIRERNKRWRLENADVVRERAKQYYANNKEKVQEAHKKHRATYRDPAVNYTEDWEHVEGYDRLIADGCTPFNMGNHKWCVHHRLEDEGFTVEQLIAAEMYYNRPAKELIIMTSSEHMAHHHKLRRQTNANV